MIIPLKAPGAVLIDPRLRRWPALAARVECVGDLQPLAGDVEGKAKPESSNIQDFPWDFPDFPWDFPWDFPDFPWDFPDFPWDFPDFPWDFPDFPWDFPILDDDLIGIFRFP